MVTAEKMKRCIFATSLNKSLLNVHALVCLLNGQVFQKRKLLEQFSMNENRCHKSTHLITSPAAVAEEYPTKAASLH